MKKPSLTFYIRISLCVLIGLFLGIFSQKIIGKGNQKNKTVVGFYQFDSDWQKTIEEILTADNSYNFTFRELSEKEILDKNLTKKVDLLFTKNSATVQRLKIQALPLSNAVKERIPQTIKKSAWFCNEEKTVVMPVVIDNFEMSVLKTAVNRYQLPVPQKVSEIADFAHTAKYYYATPIVMAGTIDENISSLVTQLVLSYGGAEGYEKLVSKLKTTTDFSKIFDYTIEGDAAELKLSDLLQIVKGWYTNGYLASNWLTLTPQISANLIDDNQVAISFMSLSEHRTKPQPNISYYSEMEFPVESGKKLASVQNVYVAMEFNDKEAARVSLNRLSLPQAQERLSLITKLGPAMLQGTSCDIQADDARFKAATSEAGPVPDLGTAAFEKETDRHAFAQAVRNWF